MSAPWATKTTSDGTLFYTDVWIRPPHNEEQPNGIRVRLGAWFLAPLGSWTWAIEVTDCGMERYRKEQGREYDPIELAHGSASRLDYAQEAAIKKLAEIGALFS